MNIVKTFQVGHTAFPEMTNTICSKGSLMPRCRDLQARIVLPPVHPRLALNFSGLEVKGQHCYLAVKGEYLYFWFDGGRWYSGDRPRYMHPDLVREGLASWAGAIQIEVLLAEPYSWFSSLSIGYQVYLEPLSYILDFALPQILRIPVRFMRQTMVRDGCVLAPDGFNPQSLEAVWVQVYESPPVSANYIPELRRIELASPIADDTFVQMVFDCCPAVNYVRKDIISQISQVPCVELRLLEEDSRHMEWSVVLEGFVDAPFRVSDALVDVTCIAATEADAKILAQAMRARLIAAGSIYSPPHDLTYGVFCLNNIGYNVEANVRLGNLPSFSFRCKVLRE